MEEGGWVAGGRTLGWVAGVGHWGRVAGGGSFGQLFHLSQAKGGSAACDHPSAQTDRQTGQTNKEISNPGPANPTRPGVKYRRMKPGSL